jgi:hypothetical protein
MYSDLVMRTEVPFSYCTWKTKIPLKIIKKNFLSYIRKRVIFTKDNLPLIY